jgi:hypothetical protein
VLKLMLLLPLVLLLQLLQRCAVSLLVFAQHA